MSENFKKGMSLLFVLKSTSKFCMSLKNFPPLLYSSRNIRISNSLRPHGLCSLPGSLVHRDSPGKNTGGGCHAFLQGIFPTQGLNPGLPHCRRILYHLSHRGSHMLIKLCNLSAKGLWIDFFLFLPQQSLCWIIATVLQMDCSINLPFAPGLHVHSLPFIPLPLPYSKPLLSLIWGITS